MPVWDTRAKAFTDPDTGTPLPTWDQACEELTEPTHVVHFGEQMHVKGILGGTEEAGRHIGYLTKYSVMLLLHTRDYDCFATAPGRWAHAPRDSP